MHCLELKIPPVALFLLTGLAMWLVNRLFPEFDWTLPGQNTIAGVFYAGSAFAGITAVIAFFKARTTIHPGKPEDASSLVHSGIYRITRNPMYLALLLSLIGWTFTLANPLNLLVLPIFVLYMNRFQIIPEERMLLKLFGSDFSAYQQSVRRWL
ncbi:MAG: conserved rane protein of unknown function [Proteobacteria bacterium]|nr:conserved rane protein of unknown function [Pseudomonadota bacterium]